MCIEIITRSVFSKLPTALTLNIGNATIKNQRPMRNFSSERDDLSIVVIISLRKNSQEPMKSWFHNI